MIGIIWVPQRRDAVLQTEGMEDDFQDDFKDSMFADLNKQPVTAENFDANPSGQSRYFSAPSGASASTSAGHSRRGGGGGHYGAKRKRSGTGGRKLTKKGKWMGKRSAPSASAGAAGYATPAARSSAPSSSSSGRGARTVASRNKMLGLPGAKHK